MAVVIQSTSPSRLADFTVLGRLGSGSFGTVYKVQRKQDGLTYVLKQIQMQGLSESEQRDAINEVQIMASLDHPNCVHYYDSFIDEGKLNIVMEFCDRGDLQRLLENQKGRKLSEERVWSVFLQISLALHYLHTHRVLHRDMKSANVFLCKGDVVKLGDLGVARVLGTNTNFAKTCVGTPYYLSPELCQDKPYNEKSDVWALGCTLYECCTLRHPFDASNQGALILKIIQGQYPPVSSAYSPELRKLVDSLLQRSTAKRPTIAEVLTSRVVMAKAEELGIALPEDLIAAASAKKEEAAVAARALAAARAVQRQGSVVALDSAGDAASTGSRTATTGHIRGGRVRGRGDGIRRPKRRVPATAASTSPPSVTGMAVFRGDDAKPAARPSAAAEVAALPSQVTPSRPARAGPKVSVNMLQELTATGVIGVPFGADARDVAAAMDAQFADAMAGRGASAPASAAASAVDPSGRQYAVSISDFEVSGGLHGRYGPAGSDDDDADDAAPAMPTFSVVDGRSAAAPARSESKDEDGGDDDGDGDGDGDEYDEEEWEDDAPDGAADPRVLEAPGVLADLMDQQAQVGEQVRRLRSLCCDYVGEDAVEDICAVAGTTDDDVEVMARLQHVEPIAAFYLCKLCFCVKELREVEQKTAALLAQGRK